MTRERKIGRGRTSDPNYKSASLTMIDVEIRTFRSLRVLSVMAMFRQPEVFSDEGAVVEVLTFA